MRKNILYVLLMLLSFWAAYVPLSAQPYGNEWMDYNQRYFKIKMGEEGIFKMTRSELNASGFPVFIDPRGIQLFHRGKEVAIEITGEADGRLDVGDALLFYAQPADGAGDTPLYTTTAAQPHAYYSLFSDTSAYFLTYSNSSKGLRMKSYRQTNTSGVASKTHFLCDSLRILHNDYHQGSVHGFGDHVVLPAYDYGEGWTGSSTSRWTHHLQHTLTGLIDRVTVGTPAPRLEVFLVGRNNNPHQVDISVGASAAALRDLTDAQFHGASTQLVKAALQWSDFSAAGELVVSAKPKGGSRAADRFSISYIKVTYSRSYNMNGAPRAKFRMPADPASTSYMDISNAPPDVTLWDITDPHHPIPIGITQAGSRVTAGVRHTATSRMLYAQSGTKVVTRFKEVSFQRFDPAVTNYVMISHKALRGNTTGGQGDPVRAYKDYRQSAAGGGHVVLDMNIDQVFDQFNYGEPSPIAIRRLCEYVLDQGSPRFLFLIGKASNVSANYYRNPAAANAQHFVPTFGYPGSDVYFSVRLNGSQQYPAIPTGRINATQPDDVLTYLNKVKEQEAAPYRSLRRKTLIHLSGGANEQELKTFRTYIDGFAQIADGKLLGGKSIQISKNTNAAVEFINISDEVNQGVMMVTFLGHSGATVTDVEIGIVSNPAFGYDNKGKYPVFLVNGCAAGDFFTNNSKALSFGVDWILTPNKGAVAFVAHSHDAFPNNLKNYTDAFYQVAFTQPAFVGKSVGEIKKEAAKQYLDRFGAFASHVAQVQLMNLQGDPAVKIFGLTQPDYAIDPTSVKAGAYDGKRLLASADSFYLAMKVKNYGMYADQPLDIEVKRTFADGSQRTYAPVAFAKVLRENTFRFNIPNDVSHPEGQNTFLITLNPRRTIGEADLTNNTATFQRFLASGSTFNLLPAHHSIQKQTTLDFYFQASNPLVGRRAFDIEIDTLPTFNSPYLMRKNLSADVIGKLPVNLAATQPTKKGTVFYWRTRFTNPLPNEDKAWVVTSFVFHPTWGEGWAQSRAPQLQASQLEGLTYSETTGVWAFQRSQFRLQVKNYGSAHKSLTYQNTQVLINQRDYFVTNSSHPAEKGCRNNTINFMAFKRQSGVPFHAIPTEKLPRAHWVDPNWVELIQTICGLAPQYIYNYTPSELANATYGGVAYMQALAQGDHVVIFSLGKVDYSKWSPDFKAQLEKVGIIRAVWNGLQDGEPVIFFGVKGAAANTAIVKRTTATPKNEQSLTLSETISSHFDIGTITSPLIGPAAAWKTLNIEPTPASSSPSPTLAYYGVKADQSKHLIGSSQTAQAVDLSTIDARTYPYLQLKMTIKNQATQPTPQVPAWRVAYEDTPEGILLIRDRKGIQQPIAIPEGQNAQATYTYWNFSRKDFPAPLKIKYDLFHHAKKNTSPNTLTLQPLKSGDSAHFQLDIKTLGKQGLNDLTLRANAEQVIEKYRFNNRVRLPRYLKVLPDKANPILQVFFDGIPILDNDIVSPTPTIHMELKDPKAKIFVQDPKDVFIYLQRPCEGCEFERIEWTSPEMQWTPATKGKNFTATYTPRPLSDGRYALRVTAKDASGNASGTKPYEIHFRVINASTITHFYPYPNPFSTRVQFVFTLTGNTLPEDLKIQIMTLSGRVVKEIFMSELGRIRIGNNRTDYAWDGRDQFGDLLANGVYLYRIFIKSPGENFKPRDTAGDKAFKNGFGKMYLLR